MCRFPVREGNGRDRTLGTPGRGQTTGTLARMIGFVAFALALAVEAVDLDVCVADIRNPFKKLDRRWAAWDWPGTASLRV